jgi:hypothetical protein
MSEVRTVLPHWVLKALLQTLVSELVRFLLHQWLQ